MHVWLMLGYLVVAAICLTRGVIKKEGFWVVLAGVWVVLAATQWFNTL